MELAMGNGCNEENNSMKLEESLTLPSNMDMKVSLTQSCDTEVNVEMMTLTTMNLSQQTTHWN